MKRTKDKVKWMHIAGIGVIEDSVDNLATFFLHLNIVQ